MYSLKRPDSAVILSVRWEHVSATCGALCGAQMVQGLVKFEGHNLRNSAAEMYKAFTEKCGGSICKELKGAGTGKVLCSCDDCVRNAVEILEQSL